MESQVAKNYLSYQELVLRTYITTILDKPFLAINHTYFYL